MFAVPGWAVSSSSLVKESNRLKNGVEADNGKKSKKRKRDYERPSVECSIIKPRLDVSEIKHERTHAHLEAKRKKSEKKLEVGRDVKNGHNAPLFKSDKLERKQVHDAKVSDIEHDSTSNGPTIAQTISPSPSTFKLTPLQAKMRNKLTSARFRHLNETLYTTPSDAALTLFTNSPELFAEYHAGFSQQVRDSWPQNPVEGYIKSIRTRGSLSDVKNSVSPLPRRKTGSCTIADLGCGDAPLARGCQSVVKSSKLKFHNYDLHTPNSFVTKADISNLPLRDGEADIVVFCLSLMGTNWVSFVEEAWRILRGDGRGEVWVAEVKSRFGKVTKGRVVENSVGKRRKKQKSKTDKDDDAPEQFIEDERNADTPDNETDVSNFVKIFTRRGFQLKDGSVNKGNKMFVSMVFFKTGIPTTGKHKGLKWNGKEYVRQPEPKARFVNGQKDDVDLSPEEEAKTLKPCVYKTR